MVITQADLRIVEGIAGAVPDPEMPAVTLAELGILRGARHVDGRIVVDLTPTYLGCPALREMKRDVARQLSEHGYDTVEVHTVLAPAWTSDWITDEGRVKLAAAGIAPPNPVAARPAGVVPLDLSPTVRSVRCPRCGSSNTTESARFSATACTALFRCGSCGEPFSYVKDV
jgi:ring-1,2-phenylacetyl-CoA epoxidase subunit PaaD